MIGIDIGSSFLTVARISPESGNPEAVKFKSKQGLSAKLPSVLVGIGDGFVIGHQAMERVEQYAALPPDERWQKMASVVPNILELLTPDVKEYINGRDYTHAELLKSYFSLFIEDVKAACLGDDAIADYVVLTHPATIAHPKLEMMVEALHAQGVSRVKTLAKPFAAAKGYEMTHIVNEGEGLLVFNYGAVGADACYLKKQKGKLTILAVPGANAHCGGNDLDYLLYEHLHNYLLKSQHRDISEAGLDLGILQRCQQLKELLGSSDDAVCETDIPQAGCYRLSREAFNAIIYPKVDEAVNVARMVAGEVKERKLNIDKVLLVGGSSRLPLVKTHLAESFPNTSIEMCCDDDTIVARGAIAQYAVGPDSPFCHKPSIICPKCQSPLCYRYKEAIPGRGFVYHCMECEWEGPRVRVIF